MIRKFITKFIQGDSKRTAFSADTMNELVGGLNQFLGTRAGKGIVITRSDSGWVIEWDPTSKGEDAILGEGGGTGSGTGNIAFQGDWSGAETYDVNDIVIKQLDPTNFNDGSASTYICIADVTVAGTFEPGVASGWATYWAVFANGFWKHIKHLDLATGKFTDINGAIIQSAQPSTDARQTVISPALVKTFSISGGATYAGLSDGNFLATDGSETVTGSPGKIKGVKYSANSYSTLDATISSGSVPRSFEFAGGFGYISHYTGTGVKPRLFVVRVDPNCAVPTFAESDRVVFIDLSAAQTIADSSPKLIKIREIDVCKDGAAKKMLVLCSEAY